MIKKIKIKIDKYKHWFSSTGSDLVDYIYNTVKTALLSAK